MALPPGRFLAIFAQPLLFTRLCPLRKLATSSASSASCFSNLKAISDQRRGEQKQNREQVRQAVEGALGNGADEKIGA
jgi:hypothetical protein